MVGPCSDSDTAELVLFAGDEGGKGRSVMLISLNPCVVGSVLFALRQCNPAGKVIIVLLFVGSIFAWTIMLTKYIELRQAAEESHRFIRAFRHEGHPLALFLRRRRFDRSPLFRVYQAGCRALAAATGLTSDIEGELLLDAVTRRPLSQPQAAMVRETLERYVADEAMMLEEHMGFLATAVSASPFLGLLGTVWGVMDAFGGMAVTGSATLGAVAPGISGALLTTVVGLLVAIPSSIGYNVLAHRIRRLVVQMDNFSQEFYTEIQRNFSSF